MNTARTRRAGESGSVLLGTLVLVFVLLVLGLALFASALIDSQLAMASLDDYRALESAQAGMERALYRLNRHLCGGDARCANPSPVPNWLDGTIDGQTFAVEADHFVTFIPQAISFQGVFPDPRGPGYPSEEYAGAYTVELKHLTRQEATTILGLVCAARLDTDETCRDLIYVRATGSFGRTAAEPVAMRTVQAVAQARAHGAGFVSAPVPGLDPYSAGAGSVAILAETIVGSPEIHGALHMVPCGAAQCSPLLLSAGRGIRNNYNNYLGIPSALELPNIIPRLPVVLCQPSTACAGLEVETLEAKVRIAKPTADPTVAINIQSADASLGEEGTGTINTVTGVRGKPTMDGIYLGRGCEPAGATPPCADVIGTNPARSYADGPVRAYDAEPPWTFPKLDDGVAVLGRDYTAYAACPGPGNCTMSASGDFFISHAHRIVPGTEEEMPPDICDETGANHGTGAQPCELRDLHQILTDWGLRTGPGPDGTATFRKNFECNNASATRCDEDGDRVNGWVVNALSPKAQFFQLEWRGYDWMPANYPEAAVDPQANLLVIYQCTGPPPMASACASRVRFTPGGVTTGGVPLTGLDDVVRPVMFYVDGELKITCAVPPCGTPLLYQGHGMFLAKGIPGGGAVIEVDVIAACVPGSDFDCSILRDKRRTFPQRSLLTLYTPGRLTVGLTGPRSVMGRLYAGQDLVSTQAVNLVGGTVARVFDLGPAVARFWEVKLPLTPTALPFRGPQIQPPRLAPRWTVATVKWKECPPGSTNGRPC